MAGAFETANELVILLARRKPQWVSDAFGTVAPEGDAGVALNDAPTALIGVVLRAVDGRLTQTLTIDSGAHDTSTTYGVTVNGNAVTQSASGDADADETASDLADAINADGTVSVIVSASVEGNVITLTSVSGVDTFTFAGTTSGGSGTVTEGGDASSMDVTVFLRQKPQTGGATSLRRWVKPNNGAFTSIDRDGLAEEVRCGGYDRIYIRVDSVTPSNGDYTLYAGPANVI